MQIIRYSLYEGTKIPVLDYLKNNLKDGDFALNGEHIYVDVKKSNQKEVIKVINALRFTYGYYVRTVIEGVGQYTDPTETKGFCADVKYNIEQTFLNTDYDNDEVAYTVEFDPKYSSPHTKALPDVLYHITERSLVPAIKKYGLIPKTNNRLSVHPKRVYLCLNMKAVNDLLEHDKFSLENPTVLTINTLKLYNTKFYTDLSFPGGIYTDCKIPVDCIESYELD